MHSVLIHTAPVLNIISLWSQCHSMLEASAKYRFLHIRTVQPVAVNLEQRGLEQQYTTLRRSVNRNRDRNIYNKSYCL